MEYWSGGVVDCSTSYFSEVWNIPAMLTDDPLARWNDSAVRPNPATMRTIVWRGRADIERGAANYVFSEAPARSLLVPR
jgi:hypothetical protein